jgi:hypothetical protein
MGAKAKPYGKNHVLLSKEMYNKLKADYALWHKQHKRPNDGEYNYTQVPWVGMVGRDENDVVRMCQPIHRGIVEGTHNGGRGCSSMPSIPSREMAKAAQAIAKAGYIPCGVFRIGDFDKVSGNLGTRGKSPLEIGRMGGFVLSITYSGIGADYSTSGYDHDHKVLTVAVVP